MKIHQYKDQQGYLLIIAIFVLLVLSTFSLGVLSQYKNYKADTIREMQYQRSYYAAISSISLAYSDFKLNKICRDNEYIYSQPESGLKGFRVKVTCSQQNNYLSTINKFTAIAEYAQIDQPNYVKRTVYRIY